MIYRCFLSMILEKGYPFIDETIKFHNCFHYGEFMYLCKAIAYRSVLKKMAFYYHYLLYELND